MTKALIKMGQHTIIERTIKLFRDLFDQIIIVTNTFDDYLDLGVQLTKDLIPEKGPLGGIYSGLTISSSYYNFIIACDMPFIDPSIIRHLQKFIKDNTYDVVIPEYNGFIEPLCAIYSKSCIQPIKTNLNQNHLKIRDFFTKIKVKEVPCHNFNLNERRFFNINTREDLQLARKLNCG